MRDYTSAEITALIERNRQLRAELAAESERVRTAFALQTPKPAQAPATTNQTGK